MNYAFKPYQNLISSLDQALMSNVEFYSQNTLAEIVLIERILRHPDLFDLKQIKDHKFFVWHKEDDKWVNKGSFSPDFDCLLPTMDLHDFALFMVHASDSVYAKIRKNLDNLNLMLDQMSSSQFSEFFDGLLTYIEIYRGHGHSASKTPDVLVEVMTRLFDFKPGDIVYNPFSGSANIASQLAENVKYIGEDINRTFYELASMRLLVKGDSGKKVYNTDSFLSPTIRYGEADVYISSPPLNMKFSHEKLQLLKDVGAISEKGELEVLRKSLEVTNSEGRAVVLVSDGVLYSGDKTSVSFRKSLVQNDFLEAIISLPTGTLYNTGTKTSIVVLNKNKSKKGFVLYIDTEKLVENNVSGRDLKPVDVINAFKGNDKFECSIIQDNETIIKDELVRLHAGRFSWMTSKELAEILAPGEEMIKLEKLVKKASLTAVEGVYPIVKVKDLNREIDFKSINVSTLDLENTAERKLKVLNTDAVLVARVGKRLKASIFRYGGNPVAIHANVVALIAKNPKLDLEYLLLELQSEHVQVQHKRLLKGSTISYIPFKELSEIEIRISFQDAINDIEEGEQKKAVISMKEAIASKNKSIEQLAAEVKGVSEDEYEILSFVRHSLRPLLSRIDKLTKQIESTVDKQKNAQEIFEYPLSESENAQTLGAGLKRIQQCAEQSAELFDTMESIVNSKKSDLKLERFNLIEFIQNEFPNLGDFVSGINVYFSNFGKERKSEATYLYADKNQFLELLRNVVQNAAKHGFEEGQKNKVIYFDTRLIEMNNSTWSEITISNNGRPLSKNIDFNKYISIGGRSSKKVGSGIGGYLINKVVENHNGELKILDVNEVVIDESIDDIPHSATLGRIATFLLTEDQIIKNGISVSKNKLGKSQDEKIEGGSIIGLPFMLQIKIPNKNEEI
jgi:type I restriction enzyme M protein